jgi:hypothetical protein
MSIQDAVIALFWITAAEFGAASMFHGIAVILRERNRGRLLLIRERNRLLARSSGPPEKV